ncbi:cell cycle histidine kinase CckA [Oricola thermophila]|uniref:histidine kinase n=1 Tax=Oricola thermophila TaxID=2742145 RepID=A0A6N1VDJ5_9HYPH|nr:PAS domain-containing sensor histidine kinase [Oricola thermophila]QKV17685.1 response regulator [Oricola thermophila]
MADEYRALGHSRNPPSAAVRLLILGVASLGAAAFLFFYRENINETFLLVMLGLLAMVGVFYLFASAIGFVEFAQAGRAEDIGRSFVDQMSDGICILDEKGAIVYSNRTYGDMTGISGAEDLQTPEAILSRHDDAANAVYRLANNVIRGMEADEEFRLPTGLRPDDDGPHWYRVSTRMMKMPGKGEPLRVWRLADITAERDEQEQTFLELQKAIDYLDQAPAGFFSADGNGRIQYVNATLAGWLGIDLTAFVPGSLNISDIVTGDGLAIINAVRADAGTSRTATIDVELAKADGVGLPVQMIHRVHADKDGLAHSTRTIVLNRSETGETASDLRRSEVRFTRFFNSTPMAIAALDQDGRILRTNAPFITLFGAVVDADALEGHIRFEALFEGDAKERFNKAFAAARANQAKIEPFDTVLKPGPDERHLRVFVNAITGQGGPDSAAEEAAIVYAMDTTEQKALEAQMAQSQKMQAVGQLAGGIAHDFNNVLTAIIMASDLLLANHRPSDPSFADIMNIKQNANRAASLVRQLLAFSRRQTLRPEVLTLTDVLADLRMLLSRLVGNSINLQIEHGRDLWPVKADLGQFEQVIVNLAVNARDAMPEGGDLTIRTSNVSEEECSRFRYRGFEAGEYVMIEVEDTGTGIEPDVLEKIFEPFFTTKEVGKGTGLGLSMVYGIVKQTGGFIYADSEIGKGTIFRIFLPRHIAAETDAPVARPEEAGPEKKRDLSGTATVLLVEDEDAVRMGGVRALTSRGYTVHEASSGVEALEIIAELDGKVDIVVSDVVMPEMDGPTLLAEMRNSYPDIKFIFVSGYAEDAFAKNLPEGAKFGFLPKPFSLKQLATTVKEMLEDGN